ncbi:MAG: nicotinate (nicotinamide) nucleotide adenylyltransferase [Bacteroidales bacterium]|nr:nicotinate (nicotinamide) nucleotide adenylyltransferase [Bacteroidales bacterium]
MMKIAVYPGSFNPLHIGHQAIIEFLTKEKKFDWVYLIVSPKNPIKSTISADSAKDRYEAAVSAVKRHPELRVWVDDIELHMAPPQYTIKTLDALRRREPDNEFTLVIGADNLEGIHKWRDFPRILIDYGVAVFPRKGIDLKATREALMRECHEVRGYPGFENLVNHMYDIEILDAPMVNISSTIVREGLERGDDMSEYLM